jgi:hypothetical protein
METKVRNHCGRELTTDNFYKRPSSLDGYQAICKTCQHENAKKYNRSKKQKESAIDNVVKDGSLCKAYAHPELASFPARKLLEEIKARGYTWEKMFAPRQEIDYRKI